MKNVIIILMLLDAFSSFSQKDSIESNLIYHFDLSFNKYKTKKKVGTEVLNNYTSVYQRQQGANLRGAVGVDWRNWQLSYAFSYSKIEEYKNYLFRNSSGGYDLYMVDVNLKSVINSIEISRILKIPDSKYSFEVGAGMGFNYLFAGEKYDAYDSLRFGSNDYGIRDNKMVLNPSKVKTIVGAFFMRFYRELTVGSIGVSIQVVNIPNPYLTEFYTSNKYAFYTTNYDLPNVYPISSMTSFGLHYKLKLSK